MLKVDSQLLVCAVSQVQQLVALGIVPVSCFCYEWMEPNTLKEISGGRTFEVQNTEGKQPGYEFAGEFMGQGKCIPAWTADELDIFIGGDYVKPDMYASAHWAENKNMMAFFLDLPTKKVIHANRATCSAELLYWLITTGEVKVEDCNARMTAFLTKEHFNPQTDKLNEKRDK